MIFDCDASFNDDVLVTIKSFGIRPKRTSFQSPWQSWRWWARAMNNKENYRSYPTDSIRIGLKSFGQNPNLRPGEPPTDCVGREPADHFAHLTASLLLSTWTLVLIRSSPTSAHIVKTAASDWIAARRGEPSLSEKAKWRTTVRNSTCRATV